MENEPRDDLAALGACLYGVMPMPAHAPGDQPEAGGRQTFRDARCVPLVRLVRGASGAGFRRRERRHLATGCTYCEAVLTRAFSYVCPSDAVRQQAEKGQGAQHTAVERHGLTGGCAACQAAAADHRRNVPASRISLSSRSPRSWASHADRTRPSDRWRWRPARHRVLAAIIAVIVFCNFGALQVLPASAAVCTGDQDVPGAAPAGRHLSGKSLLVAALWSGQEQERFFEVLRLFEEQTGAKVRYDSVGHDIGALITARINADCPPDVVLLPQPGLLQRLASDGSIQPVEDVVGQLVNENYGQAWRDLATVRDKAALYGVWYKATNKSLVWYNPKLFEDLGIKEPTTWEEFKKAAASVIEQTGGTVAPLSLGTAGADGWVATDIFENVFLQTAGPDLYGKLVRHQISWTDPSVKQALRVMAEVFANPELVAGGAEHAARTSFEESVNQVFTEPPRAAMVYEADYLASYVKPPAVVGQDADAFPFPTIKQGSPSFLAGGDVAALVSKTSAAKELLRFLAKPEAAEPWARAGGFVSPNKKVPLTGYPANTTGRSAKALVDASDVQFDLSDLQHQKFGANKDGGMWQILRDYLQRPDVDATAQRLEEAWASTAVAPAKPDTPRQWSRWRAALKVSAVVGVLGLVLTLVYPTAQRPRRPNRTRLA